MIQTAAESHLSAAVFVWMEINLAIFPKDGILQGMGGKEYGAEL